MKHSEVDSPTLTVQPSSADRPVMPSYQRLRSSPETSRVEPFASDDLVMLSPIAQGGMGRVMLGQQRSLGREVALKLLRLDRSDAGHAASLLREARILGSLEHPNIVPVHALGLDELGQPVIVMKRIDGVTLRTLLAQKDHEGWRWLERSTGASGWLGASLEALIRIAGALEFAHSRGVLHRDIKPDNILVGRFGEVYLADWGVAVRTNEEADSVRGEAVGTPAYMAPEMVAPYTALTPLSDVYLLGATLHEILTGQKRHQAPTSEGSIQLALRSEPFDYDPEVPRELAALCNAATSLEPSARPPSAAAFREALRAYVRHATSQLLTHEAQLRLEALRPLIDHALAEENSAPEGLHRALIESRFAFTLALREWPSNPEATEGLRLCLREAARFELGRGDLEACRALLHELGPASDDLRREFVLVEQRRARERAQVENIVRQHDASYGARSRLALSAALFVSWVLIVLYQTLRHLDGSPVPPDDLLVSNVVQLGVMALTTAFCHQTLLASEFNRRFLMMFFASYTLMLAHRLIGRAQGTSLGSQLAGDSLVLGAVVLLGAQSLPSPARVAALAPLLGALVMALLPSFHPGQTFVLSTTTLLTLLLISAVRGTRVGATPLSPPPPLR